MRDRITDLDFFKRIQTLNLGIIHIKLYAKPQNRKRLPREKVARKEKGVMRQPWCTPTFRVKAEGEKS